MRLSPMRMPTRPVMIISGSEPSRPTSQPPVMSGTSSGSGTPRAQVSRTKRTRTYAAGPWKLVRKWNSQYFRLPPTFVLAYARSPGAASSRLPFGYLPDEELAQRRLGLPQPLGKVFRQHQRELQRRPRVRLLQFLEVGAAEEQKLHVVHRQR